MIDLLDPTNVITRMFNAEKYEEMYNYCKNLLESSNTFDLPFVHGSRATSFNQPMNLLVTEEFANK